MAVPATCRARPRLISAAAAIRWPAIQQPARAGDPYRKVGHGVDEDQARPPPAQRQLQSLWPELQVEAALVGMAGDAAEALGEGLGVAVSAARADLAAAGDRVPAGTGPASGVASPLDAGLAAHDALSLSRQEVRTRKRAMSGARELVRSISSPPSAPGAPVPCGRSARRLWCGRSASGL